MICKSEYIFLKKSIDTDNINIYRWSGHIAFPGGKEDPGDKTHLDTVIRECKEEIGLDLDSPHFISLGTLEHRRITEMKTKTLMMTLVPHGKTYDTNGHMHMIN